MRDQPKLITALIAAMFGVLAAWDFRLLLSPVFGDRVPFITFFPMVFVLAWWGGFWPTFLAALLSVPVIAYAILEPVGSFVIRVPEYRFGLGVFFAVACATGWLGEKFRKARRGAQLATDKAIAEHERLRVTLASIGDAVVVTDRDGNVMSMNPVAESLTGWKQEQAIAKPLNQVFRIVNEESRQAVENPCAKVLRTGRVVGLANHTLLIAKDGTERSIDDSAAPILDRSGDILGAVVVFRDVSNRKQADEAVAFLAQASANLAALVDRESALQQAVKLPIPFLADWCVVYIIDEHGAIDYHAHSHRDPLKEHLLSEMLNKFPLDWDSNTATVRALRTGTSQLMQELPEPLVVSFTQSDEHRAMVRELQSHAVISVPLIIRNRTIGVIGLVASDPSRSYTEREVALAESFAQRVAVAVDNARLFHAIKEASRQKDEFLAMLAHELRNPLAAIRYAVAIGQMSNGDSAAEMFEIVDRQTQNLAHLIEDLLDVSRISRDKVTLRKEIVDAAAIVTRAAATVRPLMEEKSHELVLDLPEDPMSLFVDPTRAEQIVTNLLTNAAKYTKNGGRVTVRAIPDTGNAIIKVIDTGIGLPAEMLTRVFDLFAQADRTLDRSEGGLGIGLTVARKLAEMHGGSISAASEGLGQGSTFTIRLPMSPMRITDREHTSQDCHVGMQSNQRILIVDDNRDTAISCAMLLKTFGHEVQTAYDGLAALEIARTFRPQIIFLDIGLPGMNGFEVARTLREEGFESEVIVAVSGYGQPEDRQRSRDAGFDHHLVKPVPQDTLLSVLENAGLKPA